MELASREQIFTALETWVGSTENGLPNELFRFLTRLVPMINVDLLIADERLGTLLTWRHDEIYGPGWHVPGGIIRYRETAEERLRKTAVSELGAEVEFDPAPIWMEQSIRPVRQERGHMISLLYRCRLTGPPTEQLRVNPAHPEAGQWGWHRECPANLIPEQNYYRRFI
jgi:colanic acid biosynthesis protein WcaH